MDNLPYVNYNGSFYESEKELFRSSNRAFLYGDSLFETMHGYGIDIQFFEYHFNRLVGSCRILHYELPVSFTRDFVRNEIGRLIQKNRFFKGSRIRLSLFRQSGGLYTPATNQFDYIIEQSILPYPNFRLNTNGLAIDIYKEIRKPQNLLSGLKSGNSLIYVMAGLFKKKYNLDDCLLVNDNNNIVEATSSNVFLIKNGELITPPLGDGCVKGIMRHIIIDIAEKNRIQYAQRSVTIEDVADADEIFISNAISGIRWVLSYKSKRYYHQFAKDLIDMLNKRAFTN